MVTQNMLRTRQGKQAFNIREFETAKDLDNCLLIDQITDFPRHISTYFRVTSSFNTMAL